MSEQQTGPFATMIEDSLHAGSRLSTFEVCMPRIVLSEWNTHRDLSRNSASSRAIPSWKRLMEVLNNPFVPSSFGKNKAGMQAGEEVSTEDLEAARNNWLRGRDIAVIQAFFLAGGEQEIRQNSNGNPLAEEVCRRVYSLCDQYPEMSRRFRKQSAGIHKQHANRVLEAYSWHTVIVTATNWRNFYALRASKHAQPEIRDVAVLMVKAHMKSVPRELKEGEWHLPFIREEDRQELDHSRQLARVSAARCARVSYLTHGGIRDLSKDLSMADKLQADGHMSPFEHPARTRDTTGAYFGSYGGNFRGGWIQYRKLLDSEHDFSRLISQGDLLEGVGGDEALANFILSLPD